MRANLQPAVLGFIGLAWSSLVPAAVLAIDSVGDDVEYYHATDGSYAGTFASPRDATGANGAYSLAYGPDGNLYVGVGISNDVLRFDGATGAYLGTFVAPGSGGIVNGTGPALLFGSDGRLYLSDEGNDAVRRYDGATGAYLGAFVASGSGGLNDPVDMQFGPGGDLFVLTRALFAAGDAPTTSSRVYRYDGATGAFEGVFVAGGPATPFAANFMAFGPDGNLFLSSWSASAVLRYDGTTGAFLGTFVAPGTGGLAGPADLAFGPDGLLYVSSGNFSNTPSGKILRFDPGTGAYVDTFVSNPGHHLRAHFIVTPVPATAWLLGPALALLAWVRHHAGRC